MKRNEIREKLLGLFLFFLSVVLAQQLYAAVKLQKIEWCRGFKGHCHVLSWQATPESFTVAIIIGLIIFVIFIYSTIRILVSK